MDSGGGVEENPPSRDLVIRNVSQEVEGDVRKLLEKYGTITGLTMSPLNMAVAQFKDLEAAKSAKSALQDYELHGNRLKLEFPKPARRNYTLNFQLTMPLPITKLEKEKLHTMIREIVDKEGKLVEMEMKRVDKMEEEDGGDEITEIEKANDDFNVACLNAINRGYTLIERGNKLVNRATELLDSTNVVALPMGEEDKLNLFVAVGPAP